MKNKKSQDDFSKLFKEILENSNTKTKIINLCNKKLLTISDLKSELKIAYKNVFQHIKDLEKSKWIKVVRTKEQNNPSYVIPLIEVYDTDSRDDAVNFFKEKQGFINFIYMAVNVKKETGKEIDDFFTDASETRKKEKDENKGEDVEEIFGALPSFFVNIKLSKEDKKRYREYLQKNEGTTVLNIFTEMSLFKRYGFLIIFTENFAEKKYQELKEKLKK